MNLEELLKKLMETIQIFTMEWYNAVALLEGEFKVGSIRKVIREYLNSILTVEMEKERIRKIEIEKVSKIYNAMSIEEKAMEERHKMFKLKEDIEIEKRNRRRHRTDKELLCEREKRFESEEYRVRQHFRLL